MNAADSIYTFTYLAVNKLTSDPINLYANGALMLLMFSCLLNVLAATILYSVATGCLRSRHGVD